MKICNKCKEEKESNMFSKCMSLKDGLQKVCKLCKNKENKKRYNFDKEKIKNINKKWKDKNLDYNQKYYSNNKEVLFQKFQKYNEKNKEHLKKISKQYYQLNKNNIINKVKEYQKQVNIDPLKLNNKRKRQNLYNKKYRNINPHIHMVF